MSTYEESKVNGCAICMDEETAYGGCISPQDEFKGDCNHYACRACWKRVSKCFVCRIRLPIGFIVKTSEEILRDWIGDQDPLSITTLYLSYNEIVDLSPLSTLTNLATLYLSYNKIVDLSPLSTLTGLTRLYLGCNQIVDLSPLSTLTGLTTLYLGGNQIVDLSPLSTLTGLTELYLTSNKIVDLSPLSPLTNLKTLYLSGNQIVDRTRLYTLYDTIINY
jgi:hypothetical protein